MPVFLGLDCGGSTTRAFAVDENGTRVCTGQAGPANLASTPRAKLVQSLAKACAECPPPAAVCGCFAGLLDETDRETALELLRALFPHAKLRAEPDFMALLALAERADLCVIAGTGSLVCSNAFGQPQRSGGRGYLLGDAGSAFQFGRDALNAYLDRSAQASDTLRGSVETYFGNKDRNAMIRQVYGSAAPAALLARFAKALGEDAKSGAPYALFSLEQNFKGLAGVVKEHVDCYFIGARSVRIALAGGLWKASSIFKEAFSFQLSEALAGLETQIDLIKRPPVEGAAVLAKGMGIGN